MSDQEELNKFEKQLLDSILEDEDKQKNKATKGETKMAKINSELLKEWAKKVENPEKSGGKGNYFKAKQGKNVIRLLPIKTVEDLPFKKFYQHVINGKFYSTSEEQNPLTQKGWDLHNQFKDSDPEAAKEARRKYLPSERVACNVMAEGAEKPQVWITSAKQMAEIVELMDDYGDFFDIDEGRDLILTRTGTGLATRYTLVPAPSTSKLENADAVMEQIIDLDDWFREQEATNQQLLDAAKA